MIIQVVLASLSSCASTRSTWSRYVGQRERERVRYYIVTLCILCHHSPSIVLLSEGVWSSHNSCIVPSLIMQSALMYEYLLEKSRVCNQSQGEQNFHVFYLFFSGLGSMQNNEKYCLDDPTRHR